MRGRVVDKVTIAVATFLILYFASPPFLLWIYKKTTGAKLSNNPISDAYFAPVDMAYDNIPPYHSYLDWVGRELEVP